LISKQSLTKSELDNMRRLYGAASLPLSAHGQPSN